MVSCQIVQNEEQYCRKRKCSGPSAGQNNRRLGPPSRCLGYADPMHFSACDATRSTRCICHCRFIDQSNQGCEDTNNINDSTVCGSGYLRAAFKMRSSLKATSKVPQMMIRNAGAGLLSFILGCWDYLAKNNVQKVCVRDTSSPRTIHTVTYYHILWYPRGCHVYLTAVLCELTMRQVYVECNVT